VRAAAFEVAMGLRCVFEGVARMNSLLESAAREAVKNRSGTLCQFFGGCDEMT